MSATPEPTTQSQPTENIPRGTLLALLIIPAGIIAWVILWQFGFIASLVALGIAFGALWLYRFGSGGRISRTGAIRITIITVVGLLLAFLSGLVSDVVPFYASQRNIPIVSALTSSEFWDFFNHTLANNLGNVAVQFVLALVFGALGCFSVLRTAFMQTRAIAPDAGVVYPGAPAVPPVAGSDAPAAAPDGDADKHE